MLPLFAQLDETLYPSTNSSREMDVKITVSCFALLRKLLDPRGKNSILQNIFITFATKKKVAKQLIRKKC